LGIETTARVVRDRGVHNAGRLIQDLPVWGVVVYAVTDLAGTGFNNEPHEIENPHRAGFSQGVLILSDWAEPISDASGFILSYSACVPANFNADRLKPVSHGSDQADFP